MGKRNTRKSIQSIKDRIAEHQLKIAKELVKPVPNTGLIYHWQREIDAFEKQLFRWETRLMRKQRRGRRRK